MAQTHRRLAPGRVRPRRLAKGLRAAAWLCVAGACGCASSPPPRTSATAQTSAPPRPEQAAVATYDWRPLIVVPFGTLLKDMPLALNETLEFHDAESPGEAPSRDCFSVDGAAPPKVLERRPAAYRLCFEHDRLERIEAEVRLASGEAGALLGTVCRQWIGRDGDGSPAEDRSPESCTGRDGDIGLSMRLAPGPDSSATLSISLSDARPVPRE
jgi:hypothetical protein